MCFVSLALADMPSFRQKSILEKMRTPTPGVVSHVCANKGLTVICGGCVC